MMVFSPDCLFVAFLAGFLTIEQLAAGMIRPVSVGVFMGHLAACLEGGNPFEWDRRRLGIDQALENKVR